MSRNDRWFANLPVAKFPGRRYNAQAPVIFMHIPKTAGVALTEWLDKALTPKYPVRGFDRVLFGDFQAFDTFAPSERNRIYVDPSDVPANGDFVSAHMAFSTLLLRYGSANYLTVLREPVSRILSNWIFWRAAPDEYLTQIGGWAEYVGQAQKPIYKFLSREDLACVIDNLTVRMLLWPHPLIPNEGFIKPKYDKILLKEAIDRLKQFSFADIIENSRIQENLQTWLGRSLTCSRANETVAVPAPFRGSLHDELTAEAIALLETRSRLDLSLWLSITKERVSGIDPNELRRVILLRNVARCASLLAGGPNP